MYKHNISWNKRQNKLTLYANTALNGKTTLGDVARNPRADYRYKTACPTGHKHSNQKHTKVMPHLSSIEGERAIGMAQQGATNTAIARTLGCTRIRVSRLMQRLRQGRGQPVAPVTTQKLEQCLLQEWQLRHT